MNSRITGNKRKWKIYSFDSILFEKIQYYDSLRVNFYIRAKKSNLKYNLQNFGYTIAIKQLHLSKIKKI